jgi:choline dehydrogenase-like flavoprotein
MHRAVLTRPLDNRAACFYATPCGHGCSIGAAFQTTTSLLPMAKSTGLLEVRTDAMVKSVTTDALGQVTGVSYIDKKNRHRTTRHGQSGHFGSQRLRVSAVVTEL